MRALLLLLFASTVLGGGVRIHRHPWRTAFEVKGRRYVVETNTYPEIARSLLTVLEESHALFEDRFGPLTGRAARRMRVQLYGTREEYMELGGGVEGAVGHYDAALDRCAIAWRGRIGATGWPIAVHEACHFYVRRRYPHLGLPSWYGEGIACYFEGLQDPTTPGGISRLRVRPARAALEAGDANLAMLLGTRARVREGRIRLQNYEPSRFYALAWSFVHFLVTDERYRDKTRRFELRLFNSLSLRTARRLLEEECGDLKTLERDWHRHLETLAQPEPPRPPAVYGWELEAENPFVRFAALQRLGAMPADLRPGVLRCMRDEDLYVRIQACRAMAPYLDADAVPAMTEALDVGSNQLKTLALKSLAHPSAAIAVPRLSVEREDRAEALEALAAIGDPAGYPALRSALTDRLLRARTRARCAGALARDPGSVAALIVAASDSEVSVRTAARHSLLQLGREAGTAKPRDWRAELDFLRREIELGRREIHPRASYALLRLAGEQGVDQLIEIARDLSAPAITRARACALLALAKDERAIPLLRRLCRPREDELVRLEALRALVHITGEKRGFEAGQPARAREAVYRAWAAGR